ncbi:MAG: RAMP superfamily CRISPR-associated protein [Clostridia bacterium]|nr:RAMP superfamily CRISPR-associated protein [Clostridia bacterium]
MQSIESGNWVCRRYCIRIRGKLLSPLLVGSGEDDLTNMDVILDEKGLPFVPGSSLAGAMSHYLMEIEDSDQKKNNNGNAGADYKRAVNYLFCSQEEQKQKQKQSRLFVYDMKLKNAKLHKRDGVKLDEFKTAVNLGKYEMQIVERGAEYEIRLELVIRKNDLKFDKMGKTTEKSVGEGIQYIKELLTGLDNGELTLGAKNRRGFGRLKVNDIRVKPFDMTKRKEHQAWLDWDWEQEGAFKNTSNEVEKWSKDHGVDNMKSRFHCLRIPLKIRNSMMIRQYKIFENFNDYNYDYEQLKSNGEGVIPGTSWMGAIRGRLRTILQSEEIGINSNDVQRKLESVFGTWTNEEQEGEALLASAVKVEESIIKGGHGLPMTRNAIDRFTGGTVSGALYSSVPWIGGQTELVLRWVKGDKSLSKVICGLLLWVAEDLQNGLLAVGGETAIGRGIFEPNGVEINGGITLDGEFINEKKPYYKAAINWCKQSVGKEGDVDGRREN